MSGRACGVCGSTIVAGARFCPDCGAPLDATVVSLERDDPTVARRRRGRAHQRIDDADQAPHDEAARLSPQTPRPRRWKLVAVATVGVIALWAALASTSPDQPADDAALPREQPTLGGTQRNQAPRPVPSATQAPSPTRTPRPTPTPAVAAAPVDPAMLPAMDTTHLGVASRGNLQFLDLRTGTWTRTDIELTSEPSSLFAVSGGVIVTADSGSWFAPDDGSDPTSLTIQAQNGWIAGFGAESYLLVQQDDTGTALTSRSFDGTERWTHELSTTGWTNSVTTSGNVFLQYGERIVLLDGASGDQRVVATGTVVAAAGEDAVIWSCDEALECATVQVDSDSGARTVVSEDYLYLERIGSDAWRAYPQQGGRLKWFRLTDGVLTQVARGGDVGIYDANGTRVSLQRDGIAFTDTDGTERAKIPSPIDTSLPVLMTLLGPPA